MRYQKNPEIREKLRKESHLNYQTTTEITANMWQV